MKIEFKSPELESEYQRMPLILRLLSEDFVALSNSLNKIPVVTRILEAIPGSSGTHESARAIDFRMEYNGRSTYTEEEIKHILDIINEKWHRNDGKPTAICHSFQGGPRHYHLQISNSTMTYWRRS